MINITVCLGQTSKLKEISADISTHLLSNWREMISFAAVST